MKKFLFLFVLLAGLITSGYVYGQKVAPQLQDGKYFFQVANVYFEVDPSFGARISGLKVDNTEIMFVDSSNGSYLWGSTFWQSPQSEWNWPPSTALDQNPYKGGIHGDSISFLGSVDNTYNTNLRFRKTFYADLSDTSVTIIYSMINTGSTAHSYSPWEISRVPAGGMFFFPYGAGNITGPFAPYVSKMNNMAWYKYQSSDPGGNKFMSDGAEGWSAWINDNNVVFIKKFQDVPSDKSAPGENEVEMYFNGPESYIELENQGTYSNIPAGDSLVWKMKWYLRNLPSGINRDKGSIDLANYVRKVVKYNPSYINKTVINNIKVYPNPANNYLKLSGLNHEAVFIISDVSGKILQESSVEGQNTIITLNNLTDGFYFYRIKSPNDIVTGKFLINRLQVN